MSGAAPSADTGSPGGPASLGADAYARRRLGAPPSPEVAAVHAALVRAACEEPAAPPRRQPSISLDGTPIVLSCAIGEASAPLRLLADPGGLARDVPEQADFALALLGELLGLLRWRACIPAVNAVATAVLPATADGARALRGGAWLGMTAAHRVHELRLYLDLRAGGAASRWGRVAAALGAFGDDRAEAALLALAQRVAPHGVPIGLGTVLAAGGLSGFRVYCGLETPSAAAMTALGGAEAAAVAELCRVLGPFAPQSVTAGFDFVMGPDGLLAPALRRTKLDVACLARPHYAALAAVHRLIAAYALPRDQLTAFLADVDACFGGGRLQYVSVGLRPGPAHVTAYVQPATRAGE